MKKSERQIVFHKYGGRCAYCGCELQKGWHVDHVEPCRRIRKWVSGNYYHKVSGRVASPEDMDSVNEFHERFEWKEGRYVDAGYTNPEANHIDNYMPACPSCNINKHGYTIEQFRANIQGYLNSLNLRMVQYKMAKRYGLVEETGKPVVFYFEQPIHQSPQP